MKSYEVFGSLSKIWSLRCWSLLKCFVFQLIRPVLKTFQTDKNRQKPASLLGHLLLVKCNNFKKSPFPLFSAFTNLQRRWSCHQIRPETCSKCSTLAPNATGRALSNGVISFSETQTKNFHVTCGASFGPKKQRLSFWKADYTVRLSSSSYTWNSMGTSGTRS
jgi:hypothetical protein